MGSECVRKTPGGKVASGVFLMMTLDISLAPYPGLDQKTNLAPRMPAMYDAHDPDSQKRYKAVIGTGDASSCVGIAWSPDGLQWTDHPDNHGGARR